MTEPTPTERVAAQVMSLFDAEWASDYDELFYVEMLRAVPPTTLKYIAEERIKANECGRFVPAILGLSNPFYCSNPKPCDAAWHDHPGAE